MTNVLYRGLILLGALILSFAQSGCVYRSEDLPKADLDNRVGQKGERVTVRFTVQVPEFETADAPYRTHTHLRASGGNIIEEPLLTNVPVTLLIFRAGSTENSAETYVYSAEAYNPVDNGDGTFTFDADLIPTSESRVIHVVVGYDFSWLDEHSILNADAGEIMNYLHTADYCMWGKLTVPFISDNDPGTQSIKLLRNVASISVVDATTDRHLGSAEFQVVNVPNGGMLAHFNPATATFPDPNATGLASDPNWRITEWSGARLTKPLETEFTPISRPIYVHERKNGGTSPVYVILKAPYNGTFYFYKIDLIRPAVDEHSVAGRYDLKRNYRYVINVTQLARAGASSVSEALAGLPVNSSVIDYNLEIFPVIYSADGTRRFSVNRTTYDVGPEASVIETNYSYSINGINKNTEVSVKVIEDDPAHPLIANPGSLTGNALGTLSIRTNTRQPGEPERKARIIISTTTAGKSVMTRSILINQLRFYTLSPASIDGENPKYYTGGPLAGQEMVLRFTVPDTYPAHLYPFEVSIATQTLTPVASMPVRIPSGGSLSYIHTVTGPGIQTIKFRANKSYGREAVIITAPNFTGAIAGYNMGVMKGTLKYLLNGTQYPLPDDETATHLEASDGELITTSGGVYTWYLPLTYLSEDAYRSRVSEISARVIAEVNSSEYYYRIYSLSQPLTPFREAYAANPLNPANVNILLNHTADLISGTIEAYNTPGVLSEIPMSALMTLTLNPGTSQEKTLQNVRIREQNRYEIEFPIDGTVTKATKVSVQIAKVGLTQNAGSITEVYSLQDPNTTVGTLLADPTLKLKRSKLTVAGEARIWGSLWSLGDIYAIVPGYPDAKATRPANGQYQVDLPPDIGENTIFQFRWAATRISRSLADLRENASLRF